MSSYDPLKMYHCTALLKGNVSWIGLAEGCWCQDVFAAPNSVHMQSSVEPPSVLIPRTDDETSCIAGSCAQAYEMGQPTDRRNQDQFDRNRSIVPGLMLAGLLRVRHEQSYLSVRHEQSYKVGRTRGYHR